MQFLGRMILITACTKRKSANQSQVLSPERVKCGPIASVAAEWTRLLQSAPARLPASETYQGQAPALGRAAQGQGTAWFIVSAGTGLLPAIQPIPRYDCTVLGKDGANVLRRITEPKGATSWDWWRALGIALGAHAPLRALIEQVADELICIALAQHYWDMVEPELLGMGQEQRDRLRIFRAPGLPVLEPKLQPYVMPYDSRLDGADSPIRGTRGSFVTRAAYHFLMNIAPGSSGEDAGRHSIAVAEAISQWRVPTIPKRIVMTDSEVKALIRKMSREGISTYTGQLRHIRKVSKVACEQSRFKRLYQEAVGG